MDEREDFQQSVLNFLTSEFRSNEWKFDGQVIRSRESNIHRVTNSATGQKLAIKAFHKSTNIGVAKVQYDALSSYQASMTVDECAYRVPKVYHFDEQYRYVLMEWLTGAELHTQLWRAIARPQKQERLGRMAGAWLKRFHEVSAPSIENIEASLFAERLNQRISKYASDSPVLNHPIFKEAKSTLDKSLKGLGKVEAEMAVIHDDFTPTNLIIRDDTVVGFDIWALGRKPVINDIARMAVYLCIAYPPLFSGEAYNDRYTFKAFLEGYMNEFNEKQRVLLKLAIMAELLRRWIVIAARKPKLTGSIAKRYQLHIIKKMVAEEGFEPPTHGL